jgi:uncharacterized membrane protein YkvA (DUF1232 family)
VKHIEILKKRAAELKKSLTAIYYAGKDPRLPKRIKVLILFTIGYALSPIDLIPDFIPLLGYLDDLIILPALIVLIVRQIPVEIMHDSINRAEAEPLLLKKNWAFGVCIIIIWALIILKIARRLNGIDK